MHPDHAFHLDRFSPQFEAPESLGGGAIGNSFEVHFPAARQTRTGHDDERAAVGFEGRAERQPFFTLGTQMHDDITPQTVGPPDTTYRKHHRTIRIASIRIASGEISGHLRHRQGRQSTIST